MWVSTVPLSVIERRGFVHVYGLPNLRGHKLKEKSSSALTEEEARKFGLNGSASRLGYDDAAVEAYLGSNGNGNSNSNRSASRSGNGASVKPVPSGSGTSVVSGRGPGEDERRRKERVEEIGREDAWFKRSDGEAMPKVSVVPGGRWNRFKTYSTIQRTLEIWGSVFAFIFKVWLNNQKFTYRGGMTEEKRVMRRKVLAKWLKESILRLGPTFIKIGQQFSTRVDILPKEYVDQLSELQVCMHTSILPHLDTSKASADQVPPFPSETAVSTIEEELGASVNEIFERFDVEPLAAASLGQVHRACLNGQEVVLKVQRPGLKELFDIDLKNLRASLLKVIAEYLQKVDPKSDGAKRDWVAIYDECANVLYQEIDYTKEAFNAEKFAENFKNMDYVKVPEIYWEYTTPQVLTMEYVPGIKINRIQQIDKLGLDRKRLGRYAVESYLEQILSHGFFHADPHPGNIAVDDANGGRLIFYDFGMMGSISPNIREGLLEVFYGVYEKDPDKVLQAMVQMGVLVPTGDMTAVRRTAQFFLDRGHDRRKHAIHVILLVLLFCFNLHQNFTGEDLLAIAADQPFRFPATFTFVVRAFSVLDGIGKGLDPRFDITEIAKPYAMELLRFNEAGVEDARKRWDRQSRAFYNVFRQPDRVEKLAQIIERLEQGDLKLRVRALESERSFQRVAAVQKTIGYGVAAGSLVNLATILHLNSIRMPATIGYCLCAFFGLQILLGVLKFYLRGGVA
uniref:ABC1 atypical kinase-like domain-containing protein n=1 Tax=Aegilops tauschii TaxID=37682 RepID=N1R5T2_AEGTA